MARPRTAALIVAAGQGTRVGGTIPKQFQQFGGRPLVAHAHAALSSHPDIDHVLVAIGPGQEPLLRDALGEVAHVEGGATRRASVRNGIERLAAMTFDRALVHDAARPFVPHRVVDALLAALNDAPGAIPALAVADTLARGDLWLGDTVERAGLWRVQTPQAFRLAELIAAHAAWPDTAEATDDAQMLRALDLPVRIVEGDRMLEKITYPADLAPTPSWISRSATGYDVHRLVAGEELWLGGIHIVHDHGLSGHSDADVALHALTDALLGTIAAGDIGQHFPPTDPQWKGAASARFLEHAAGLVAAERGIIDFVDLTIICEAPKIGPHREAIRERIGALLRLDPAQVSVKATTTERLGFTGRGEGIAALATATVRVPGNGR